MTITWLLLTFNRSDLLIKSFEHNKKNSGHKIDNIIWVDNGSDFPHREEMDHVIDADIKIFHKKNLGVAKGFNAGLVMLKTSHFVITGSDMLMPDKWLSNMVTAYEQLPNAGIITIYSTPIAQKQERIRGNLQNHGYLYRYMECMPIERRFMSRSLQREIGYFHEGFGLYAWDDIYFGYRSEMILKAKGLKCYNLVDHIAEHLGTEGINPHDGKDSKEYHEMKQREVNSPYKIELLNKLASENWPRFDPFQ